MEILVRQQQVSMFARTRQSALQRQTVRQITCGTNHLTQPKQLPLTDQIPIRILYLRTVRTRLKQHGTIHAAGRRSFRELFRLLFLTRLLPLPRPVAAFARDCLQHSSQPFLRGPPMFLTHGN